MRNREALQRRASELADEVRRKTADYEAGRISDTGYYRKFLQKASEEAEEIQVELKAHDVARHYAGGTEVATGGVISDTPQAKGMGQPLPSPMNLTPSQSQTLFMAARAKMPISMDVGVKGGIEDRFAADIITKAPLFESGIGGSFSGNLPPVQSPYAVGLGYESVRVAEWLPGVQMPGPSATWITHTSNSGAVSATPEGSSKPDISPVVQENQVKPTKLAGIVSTSLEAWQDTESYGEGAFSSWLQTELTRDLVNTESNAVINAVSGTNNFTWNGLLSTSGTLTRAVGTDSPLDAINKAIIDIRVGPAFADADLCLIHPNTYGALLRSKDADGRYVISLMSGPRGFTADGSAAAQPTDRQNPYSIIPQGPGETHGNLFGLPVVITTHVPAGTAIVMSVKAGAGIWWQRLGLLLEYDPYAGPSGTNFVSNTMTWRCEERVALSVPRPSAINILTGLPTS